MESCVLPTSIMPIHKLRAMDHQGYYTCCWAWMEMGMTLFLINARKLTVEEYGYARHRRLVAGLSPKAWIRLLASPRYVCGGQSGTGTGIFSEYLGFPVSSFSQFTFTFKLLVSGQAGKTCRTLRYGAQ